jgi:hypothetical protein
LRGPELNKPLIVSSLNHSWNLDARSPNFANYLNFHIHSRLGRSFFPVRCCCCGLWKTWSSGFDPTSWNHPCSRDGEVELPRWRSRVAAMAKSSCRDGEVELPRWRSRVAATFSTAGDVKWPPVCHRQARSSDFAAQVGSPNRADPCRHTNPKLIRRDDAVTLKRSAVLPANKRLASLYTIQIFIQMSSQNWCWFKKEG